MSETSYSEHGEDRFLVGLFQRIRQSDEPGFYVDVGAGNGITNSVSYLFERLGWRGICLEPHPQAYLECVRARPRANVLHVAMARRGTWSVGSFVMVMGDDQRSFLASDTGALQREKTTGKRLAQVPVPIAYLDVILEGRTDGIDFLTVSVNGSEYDVLQGMDLKRHKPRAIVVSVPDESDLRVEDLLARFEYVKHGRLGTKDLYVPHGT
ncbi:FkbM family methyltransferase [Candidatus Poribacteria bacterium]|nr:FkbM family methyltransferase [Candidatus Poribacteria bacterium]